MSLSPSSWPRPSPRCSVTNLLKPCLFGLLQLRSVPYPSSLSWRKGLSEIGRQWKLHSAAQKATAKPKAKSINSSVSKDKCMDEPSLIYYANGCCSVDELSRKVRQTLASWIPDDIPIIAPGALSLLDQQLGWLYFDSRVD